MRVWNVICPAFGSEYIFRVKVNQLLLFVIENPVVHRNQIRVKAALDDWRGIHQNRLDFAYVFLPQGAVIAAAKTVDGVLVNVVEAALWPLRFIDAKHIAFFILVFIKLHPADQV